MTISEILDRIFRLMRTHFRLFVGIAAVPTGAIFALYVLMVAAMALFGVLPHRPKPPGPEAMAWVMVPAMLVGIPAAIVIFALYYAAAS
jgi:hypothetical protein